MSILLRILFLTVSLARADEPTPAWTTRGVPLERWEDGGVAVANVDPGTRVEVLVVDGSQTRVRRGIDFGWIPSDALTKQAPPNAAPEPTTTGFTVGPGMTLTPKPGGTPPAAPPK